MRKCRYKECVSDDLESKSIVKKAEIRHINRRRQKGQAMLELALTLPIFMTMLLGVFEVARVFFYNVSVNNASREAARYAASSGCPSSTNCAAADMQYFEDCTGIKNRAISKSPGIGLTAADITLQFDTGHGTTATTNACSSSQTLVTGNRVIVTVVKDFMFIVPIPGLKNFTISNTTYRTYLGQVSP